MKVLMINGSPRKNGNTAAALNFMRNIFEQNGIEVKEILVGNNVEGCRACMGCYKTGMCVIDDAVREAVQEWESADAVLIGSPVYYSGISGSLKAFLDRMFYSGQCERRGKVGAAIVSVRRAGGTAALDQLNHFLLYNGMALASSSYWPMVYGNKPGEVLKDTEGMETLENLANNMIFMMKSFSLGKEQFGLPAVKTPKTYLNFVRNDL